ncbi:MAG: hypothetical protein ABIZ49_12220 [Opitutaceae bacterium]
MKRSAFLLALSLAANAVCVAVFTLRPAATRIFFHRLIRGEPPVSSTVAPVPRSMGSAPPASVAPVQPFAWSHVKPDDFAGLIAGLRTAGFPPALVQAIATAAIEQHYNARRAALRPPSDPAVYWKNTPYDPGPTAAARRALDVEQRKLLRDLLGADVYAAEDALHPERRRQQFGQLPDQKVAQLRKIFSDYDALADDAYAENPSRVSPEGRAKAALLEKEKRADIERALTPDELLHYDLLNSNAARTLRTRLGKFETTEEEFRALYPVQKVVSDLGAGMTRPFPPERLRQQREAEQQLEAEIRRVLGEARYAEFQQANDEVVQRASDFLARNNLPRAAAAPFAAVQKEARARLDAINDNRDLTPNQRDTQQAAVTAEAREKISTLLGPAGLQAYLSRAGGGTWLNSPPPSSEPK